MNDMTSLSYLVMSIIKEIAHEYEEKGILPNLCKTDDSQSIMLNLGKVANNLTFSINVIKSKELEYYLDLTVYYSNEDYVFPEGSTRENALYIIRAAPNEKIFQSYYETVGDSLAEAFTDAFYVILDELEAILDRISSTNNTR